MRSLRVITEGGCIVGSPAQTGVRRTRERGGGFDAQARQAFKGIDAVLKKKVGAQVSASELTSGRTLEHQKPINDCNLPPHPAHRVLAHRTAKQGGERTAINAHTRATVWPCDHDLESGRA